MSLPELFEYVKNGGGIAAPLLLVALIWMIKEKDKWEAKYDQANSRLQDLSEKTLILLTEIKGLFGSR